MFVDILPFGWGSKMDRIEQHIAKVAPQHLGGYRNGWLEVETFDWGAHIYNRDPKGNKKILTTMLN